MNNNEVWINVAIMDDEPLARNKIRRLIEGWSWDVSRPGNGTASTMPLLWTWLNVRLKRDDFDQQIYSSKKESSIENIKVKARIVVSAESPEEFDNLVTKRNQERSIDVIFADVRVPGKENGIQFADRWQNSKEAPVVIIVSAFDDSAVEAFAIEVADYVLKPVRGERLAQALYKALVKKTNQESLNADWAKPIIEAASKELGEEALLTVSSQSKLMNILIDDIIYFKSEQKYTTIKTKNKEYLSEMPVKKFEDIYSDKFIKVHRGCIVSLNYIEGLYNEQRKDSTGSERKGKNWFLKMKGIDEKIEISRRAWGELYPKLNINPFVAYRKDFFPITKDMIEGYKRNIQLQKIDQENSYLNKK